MESFVRELSTLFDVDPTHVTGVATGLVIDKVEGRTGATDSTPAVCLCLPCGFGLLQEG